MLYDRPAGAGDTAGVSAGGRISDRGDDVFYSGRRDVYDAHRGKCGNKYDADEKLWLMVLLTFILGFIVTISEPDLQVLAEQVPAVPNMVLVLSVAFGVGIFLVAVAAPYAVQHFTGAYADRALYHRVRPCVFCPG